MKLNDDGSRIDEEDVKIKTVRGSCPGCLQQATFEVGNNVECPWCYCLLDTTRSPLIKFIRNTPA